MTKQIMNTNTLTALIILAQADVNSAITSFTTFLGRILMLVGIVIVAWGGWQVARRGEHADGLIAIVGGFIIAMAIPIIKFFASLAGLSF
jgi:hypothetical protein